MTREEINKVFDFLEKEMNTVPGFCLKMDDACNIEAYFKNEKGNLERFAVFYIKRILKYLKENGGKDGQK